MANVDQIINKITQGNMESLNLSNKNIGNEGVIAIAEALKENQIITTLDLHNNFIGPEAATALAEVFKVNSTITMVNLRWNNMGDTGATALAEALKENSTIQSVNLFYNNIGDDGAKELAEALKLNQSITTLDLEKNNIGDEGAQSLAEALKENSTVTSLNLSHNKIEDEGATAIADAVTVNNTIKNLYLHDNNIGLTGVTVLEEAFKVNSTIIYFVFDRIFIRKISKDVFRRLSNVISDNKLSNEIISRLSDIFLLVMIPRVLPENTDAFYQHLSNMPESTLKQNLAKRFFVLQKENQIAKLEKSKGNQTEKKILLPGKFSPLNKDKQVQTWNKGSIKKNSQLQATKIYDRIHPKEKDNTAVMLMMKSDSQAYDQIYNNKNKYFTFDVNKRETVKKEEEEIWYKFNEYLSMTKQQLSLDTYVPRKLLLELFQLYVDNGIIKFSKIRALRGAKEKVLQKLNRIVAFKYINILRDELPVDDIDELKKNLIQEEQKQREKLNRILALEDINKLRDELPPAEIDELIKKYSTSSSTSKQTSTSSSTSKQRTQKQRTQKQTQTQRPYYKKLEKKIFQLHYEKIIDTIIQSNQKKIVNIQKQINQTEKQITQKQNQNFDIKKRRQTISNIMTNNQRFIKLKQIKNNEMDVIKSQTQRIQKKIVDNLLPETFQSKYFKSNKKRKSQQKQQGQKQSNKKLKIQPDTKTQHTTSTSSSPKQTMHNMKFYQVIEQPKASSSSFLHIINEKGKVEKTQQFFNPRQLDQKIKQLQQKGYKKI